MNENLTKLYNNLRLEGLDDSHIKEIIREINVYWDYIGDLEWNDIGYIDIIKEISIASFLKAKFDDENKVSVMRKTMVYRDEDNCIFKPSNFFESSIIGEPICCFANNENYWDEHYNEYDEAIYYVYDVVRLGDVDDFVAITVRPHGRALVLDKGHNWKTPQDSIRYIRGLGNGASVIKAKDGKPIQLETNNNNNIKTENYMRNNKRTIRVTESDLHRVIKESVKRILKEAAYNGNHVGRDNGNGRFEMTHPEGKYSLYFDKAQRDAHNYNAQQQGQIPNPYAGWSKRVNDGNGNWSDAEFNGEDMRMYKDDDATTTAQNLRQYDPNGAYHWDMFRGHGDQYRQS